MALLEVSSFRVFGKLSASCRLTLGSRPVAAIRRQCALIATRSVKTRLLQVYSTYLNGLH